MPDDRRRPTTSRDAAEAAYERAVNFAPRNGQAPTLLAQLRAGKAGEKIKGRR